MLYTLEAVRENLRNRQGKRVFYLGKGDSLTSGARDFLLRERIDILPASEAKPEKYRLPGGGWLEEKPEHMTHLNGDTLVPKTHLRIRFRGKLDTLEAELLLCQQECPRYEKEVGEVLGFVRELLRREVLEEPIGDEPLLGMTEAEIRKRSHFPQDYYGQPHFMPSVKDGPVILRLNRCRCAAREAELSAAEAFTDREGIPTREDLLRAMNRLSSVLYLLMIREKAGGEPQSGRKTGQ